MLWKPPHDESCGPILFKESTGLESYRPLLVKESAGLESCEPVLAREPTGLDLVNAAKTYIGFFSSSYK